MPDLTPEDVLEYLKAKGFISDAEAEMVESRWNPTSGKPLLEYIGAEGILPAVVAADVAKLIAEQRAEGLEPRLEGFILLSRLGSGARGVVYRAWQPSLRRAVAIKVLSEELGSDREYVKRFLREARVACKVSHPGIVRAFDINKQGSSVFIIMEHITGISLGDVLRRDEVLDPADALDIARQASEAIAYAARIGLVHRDIKPDNLMIDLNGRVKLCDLGLARPAGGSEFTSPMLAQGTPAYMAPEAATGGDVDARADIYSLGATLYRMLSGRLPFEDDDSVEVLRMHVEEPVPALGDDVPAVCAKLVYAMMKKEAGKRPAPADMPRFFASALKKLGPLAPRTWELVPGGSPPDPTEARLSGSAPSAGLSLVEESAAQPVVPSAAVVVEATTPARRKLKRRRGLPDWFWPAAFACLVLGGGVYIYLNRESVPGYIAADDPELESLKEENKRLKARVSELETAAGRGDAGLREAAARLSEEARIDSEMRAREPQRDAIDTVPAEVEELRRIHAAGVRPPGE